MAMSYAALRERAGFGETDWAYASEVPVGRHYETLLALTRSGTTTEIVDAVQTLEARAHGDADRGPRWTADVAGRPHRGPGLRRRAEHRADPVPDDLDDLAAHGPRRRPGAVDRGLRGGPRGVRSRSTRRRTSTSSSSATGWTVGLAHEAALKMRESAQAWAESYPAMDYRHGPIAVAGPAQPGVDVRYAAAGAGRAGREHRSARGDQRPRPAGTAGPGAAARRRGCRGARARPRPSACAHPVGGARAMRRVGVLAGVAPLVLTTFLVSGAPAQAHEAARAAQRVFVSPAGHAGAAGTRQDPLASVNEAVARLVARRRRAPARRHLRPAHRCSGGCTASRSARSTTSR